MNRCDCLECRYRRRHRDDKLTTDDMRLVLAMVALSRVMYWVAQALFAPDDEFEDPLDAELARRLRSGYFRLVYA